MAESPSRFAPVVGLGIACAALTALAGSKVWFDASAARTDLAVADPGADMPLALALGLVVLAAWGVVLVTGARVRRFVVSLGTLAALGVVACVATAPFTLPDDVRDRLLSGEDAEVSATGWYYAVAVAAVVTLALLVLAWRLVPRWPTMSSRYDAPASGGAGAEIAPETAAPIDVWKAMDEGRDPTAR